MEMISRSYPSGVVMDLFDQLIRLMYFPRGWFWQFSCLPRNMYYCINRWSQARLKIPSKARLV